MIIFDSCVWISYIIRSDSKHEEAVQLFKEISSSDLLMTEYLLLEITTVLKQAQGSETAQRFIDLISKNDISFLESQYYYKQTLLLFKATDDNNLSFVDTSLLHLSKEYAIKTFDKQLQKALSDTQGQNLDT